jgi:hypothetical protein
MNEGSLLLRVLGELGGSFDGRALDLGGRRQRAVLAALIIARGEAVDAWRFERSVATAASMPPAESVAVLEEGLALWRGSAYAEYAEEEWTAAEITRLTDLRAVARERLLAGRLDLGESDVLVPELESLLAEEPLREERWRLLVLALYRSQRQADALAALRRARETLADALGVDPGPRLRALEGDVLAQSPTLDAPAVDAPVPIAPVPVVTPPVVAAPMVVAPAPAAAATGSHDEGGVTTMPTDLVDREREEAVLARAVRDAVAGTGAFVLIDGPAGIGKTRLLQETGRLAREAGLQVLSARCSQLERSFGFGAVRQLLEPSLREAGQRELLLGGAAAGAAGVFGHDEELQRADGSFAVLHGLHWLTIRLADDGPLLLAVDDLQWCDPGSLRFLGYLVRRLETVPVLIVATRRAGAAQVDGIPAEEMLLDELAMDPATAMLRPRPLSAQGAAAVVEQRLGEASDAFVAACHSTTSGNPLLLRQLLQALEAEGVRPDDAHTGTVRAVGSRAIAGLVRLRLRRKPEEATAVARAVAVLGEGAALPVVSALAGVAEDRAAAAVDLLVRGEILTGGQPLAFVHPRVRDALYDDLPAGVRELHHERAADVLREHGAGAEQVAAHLLLAPRRGRTATIGLLRDAARIALRRGASDSAVDLLRRALEEPCGGADRTGLLVELGLAETLVDGPAAAAHLAEALELIDGPQARADVSLALARTHIFASPPGVAPAFARAAADALPAELDDARQGLVALERIAGSMSGLPPASYRDGPQPEVRGTGDGARMLAATLCYERLLDGGDRDGTIDLARFALAEDRLLDVDNGLLWVFAATVLLVSDGDLPGAPTGGSRGPLPGLAGFWERARQGAYATGSIFAAMSANLWRGYFQWRTGALDDALGSLGDAVEQNSMWGSSPVGATYIAAFTAGVHLDRGDTEAARRAVDAARCLPHVGEGTRLLHESATRLLLTEHRPAEAVAELTGAAEPFGIPNPAWAPWRGLRAQGLAALGELEEATALATEEVAALRRWGAPSALGTSLRILGELPGVGDTAEGTADLREAVQVLETGNAPVELARAQVALARAPDVAGGEALVLLRAALESSRVCGARGVHRDATEALAAHGTVAAADG